MENINEELKPTQENVAEQENTYNHIKMQFLLQ